MIRRWVLAGSVVLAAGCAKTEGGSTDPSPSPLVVTSTANQYQLSALIAVVATNTTDAPLFLRPAPCNDEQQLSAGSWQPVGNTACATVDALILVKPGASDTVPQFVPFVPGPGTYRVGVSYTSDSSFAAPSQVSFSNSFVVLK